MNNHIELSLLANALAKEIYCKSDKEEIYELIKFLNLLTDNLHYILQGEKDKEQKNKIILTTVTQHTFCAYYIIDTTKGEKIKNVFLYK